MSGSRLRTLRLLEGLFSTSTLIGHPPIVLSGICAQEGLHVHLGISSRLSKIEHFWAQIQFLGWAGREIPWIIRKNKYCGSYSEKIHHILGIQCANLVLIVSSTDGV